jgi:hypothetical protein
MHRLRSTTVALRSDDVGRRHLAGIWVPLPQALTHFFSAGVICNLANFPDKKVGQRQARQCGARLQPAMQSIRHMTQLNHFRHVLMIVACAGHVNEHQSECSRSRRRSFAVELPMQEPARPGQEGQIAPTWRQRHCNPLQPQQPQDRCRFLNGSREIKSWVAHHPRSIARDHWRLPCLSWAGHFRLMQLRALGQLRSCLQPADRSGRDVAASQPENS